ncbi:MAG: hypothetical protein ACOC29_01060 [Candidatus Sumerlaeota bacterium]
MISLSEVFKPLADIVSPDELKSLAENVDVKAERLLNNSHVHLPPNFSAFESVQQVADIAASENIGVLGVTNYYDYAVYGEFAKCAADKGIFPVFGLEIISLVDELVENGVLVNDPNNPGRFYFCAKGAVGVADPTPRGQELLDTIRKNDTERMAEMTRKVGEVLKDNGIDVQLTDEDVIAMICQRHGVERETVTIQERHIAQAYQEALFHAVPAENRLETLEKLFGVPSKADDPDDAVTIQGDLRSHLMKSGKPAFVKEAFLKFEQAHELILELKGLPCYPTLADGTDPICGYEDPVGDLIADLKDRKIHMCEFIPTRNTPEVLRDYVVAMREAGMAVVGGTEHNTLSLIPIEPKCSGAAEIPEEVKDIFWEGICVCAAHQYMVLNDKTGFVDGDGNPNADYDSDEERIRAFASMGAALIKKYREQ